MLDVETIYQQKWQAASGPERVKRALKLYHFAKNVVTHQVQLQDSTLSERAIRHAVAMRMYATDGQAVKLLASCKI